MKDIESISESFRALDEYLRGYKEKMEPMNDGPMEFWIKEMTLAIESMFERFCPFHVGDRVQLTKAPEMNCGNPGWHHCQHFLIKAAPGVVRRRTYHDGQFCFYVVFANESWIDSEGAINPVPPGQRSSFLFGENMLRPAR